AKAQLLAAAQRRVANRPAGDVGAVAALQVAQLDLVGSDHEPGVLTRDALVVDHHVAVLSPAENRAPLAQQEFLSGAALGDDEDEHLWNLRSRGRRRYHSRPPRVIRTEPFRC